MTTHLIKSDLGNSETIENDAKTRNLNIVKLFTKRVPATIRTTRSTIKTTPVTHKTTFRTTRTPINRTIRLTKTKSTTNDPTKASSMKFSTTRSTPIKTVTGIHTQSVTIMSTTFSPMTTIGPTHDRLSTRSITMIILGTVFGITFVARIIIYVVNKQKNTDPERWRLLINSDVRD